MIDDGKLTVRVVEIQGPEWVRAFQRWCLRLGCEAVHEPASLSLFFNLGGDKSGPGQLGRQSKFFTHWTMAKGAPPKKGEAMDWGIFLGKAFVAEVQRVTKNAEGEEKQDGEEYSRIVRFVRRDEAFDASPTPPSMNQESENHES